jgi:hypothetical protein
MRFAIHIKGQNIVIAVVRVKRADAPTTPAGREDLTGLTRLTGFVENSDAGPWQWGLPSPRNFEENRLKLQG